MAAHLRSIHIPTCVRCNATAKQVLHNAQNEVINRYCDRHAGAALREFQESEREREAGR